MSGISSGQNRDIHGPKLERDLADALLKAHELAVRDPEVQSGTTGVYLEVESAVDTKLPDLNWPSQDIRFGAVRVTDTGAEVGTLFVPVTAENFLATKVQEYARESTAKQKPKHEDRFAPVETVRAATVESLWTDQRPFPSDRAERIWWECWCWRDRVANLVHVAERLRLRVNERRLYFPEFEVVPVYANVDEIYRVLLNSDAIEELRRASDTPTFFTTTIRREQAPWTSDLLDRIDAPPADAPAVCILDNGVARAHPLIAPALDKDDCLSVDSIWGVDDHDPGGHGTNMAGAVLYGDLIYPLADQRRLALRFKLESVKFLAPEGFESTDPLNYGAITQAAIAVSEINKPEQPRLFCMAVTNCDVSGERPTSWSAALDQACAGAMPGDETDERDEPPRRLVFVSVGNVPDTSDPDQGSDPDEFPIEDPAQAWNAISVGGFTDKVDIAEADNLEGWKAVADVGDRSPYSRISTDWDHSRTPIKPEIVFEAGNRIALARHFGYGVPRLDRALASAEHDLALVSQTHIQPFKRIREPNEKGRLVLGPPTFNEVHYYELPWPRQVLEQLGEKYVRLKITLSYFVEPSPGETAPVAPARYQSYGLRYELKRATETTEVFRQRVNRLERGDEELPRAAADPRWTFGAQSIAAGSLHCDVWVGPAAELAARGLVAIYPVSGWWRYRTHLNRCNSRARYALVVSITAEEIEVELYTEIANLIGIGIGTEIAT